MVYRVEVLNPEAQALLESLVRLRLIRLNKLNPTGTGFWELLERLRNQNAEANLGEADILEEVEAVRATRYAKSTQGHH